MKTQVIAPVVYWLTAFLLLALPCLWASDTLWRQRCKQAMLILVSAFVVWALVFSIGIQGRMSRTSAVSDADRAEIMLKLGESFAQMENRWLPSASKSKGAIFGKKLERQAAAQDSFFSEAKKILATSVNERPDSSELKAKLAVLLICENHDSKERKEALALMHELAGAHQPQGGALGKALLAVYGQAKPPSSEETALKKTFENSFKGSWYGDQVLLRLYKVTGDKTHLASLSEQLEQRCAGSLLNLLYLCMGAFLVAGIGLITIIVQFFLWPGRQAAAESNSYWRESTSWNLKIIYVVFVSWLATEIAGGSLVQWLFKQIAVVGQGPLATAISTASTYAVSNAPALFYIYWFACRPSLSDLRETIKLRFRTEKSGLFGLVGAGIVSWCAALPIVACACYIGSKFLGSQGSSNPIINLVLDAAHSANGPAILLFYITLGVLAPLCEESLFRGFLYSNLRKRFGVGISLLVSASLFAAAHLDPGALIPLFSLGLVFGYVFERTRSLVPSMIAHGLWNAGSFTVMLLLFGS